MNSRIYSVHGGDAGKCVDYSQIKIQQAQYVPYYMYRQKNTVGNYENVGFAKEGHEGLYNIYMMEEIHSIFAAGAGAVSKLVDNTGAYGKSANIERLFHNKYPYLIFTVISLNTPNLKVCIISFLTLSCACSGDILQLVGHPAKISTKPKPRP